MKKGIRHQPGRGFIQTSSHVPRLDLLGLNPAKSNQIRPKKIKKFPSPFLPAGSSRRSPPKAEALPTRVRVSQSDQVVPSRVRSCLKKVFYSLQIRTLPRTGTIGRRINPIPLPIIPLPTQVAPLRFFITLIAFRTQTFIVRSIHAEK